MWSQFNHVINHAARSVAISATCTFPQIFPTTDSLPSSGLIPRLYDWIVSSEHLGFYFSVSSLVFFVWFPAAD